MFRVLGILVATFLFTHMAFADVFKSESELKPFADKVMSEVNKGDYRVGIEMMKPYMPLGDGEFYSMLQTEISRRAKVLSSSGKSVGFEYIDTKKIGSVVKITYIERTDFAAIPWNFYFYNSPKGWNIQGFWMLPITSLFQ